MSAGGEVSRKWSDWQADPSAVSPGSRPLCCEADCPVRDVLCAGTQIGFRQDFDPADVDVEDTAVCTVTFGNGAIASIVASWKTRPISVPRGTLISGTAGEMSVQP